MLSLKAFLGLDASGFELSMKRAQSTAEKFSRGISRDLTSRLGGLFTVAALTEGTRRIIAYASRIADLSEQLDISTDTLQKWEYAAGQSGAKVEQVAKFFEHLAVWREKARSGDRGAISAGGRLGISESDIKNMRLEDLGAKVGNAIKAGDAQKLVASLREVGGRGASALIATFKAGLDEQFAKAPIISAENIIELDTIGDKFTTLGKLLMSTLSTPLVWLSRQIGGIADEIGAIINGVGGFIGTLRAGGSLSDARRYAKEYADEYLAEQDKRRKAIEEAAAANNNRGMGGSGGTMDNKEVREAAYNATLKRLQAQGKTVPELEHRATNINALQQIGARVAFAPLQSEIQRNTQALKSNTDELRKRPTVAPEGFDGNSVQY